MLFCAVFPRNYMRRNIRIKNGKELSVTKSVQHTCKTTGIGSNEDRKLKGNKVTGWTHSLFRTFRYICHMNLQFDIQIINIQGMYIVLIQNYLLYLENHLKQKDEVLRGSVISKFHLHRKKLDPQHFLSHKKGIMNIQDSHKLGNLHMHWRIILDQFLKKKDYGGMGWTHVA